MATTVWSTLRFLATLAGAIGWFLAVDAAPVLGICMVLVLPVIMILTSTAHLGIDEWDHIKQVPAY